MWQARLPVCEQTTKHSESLHADAPRQRANSSVCRQNLLDKLAMDLREDSSI